MVSANDLTSLLRDEIIPMHMKEAERVRKADELLRGHPDAIRKVQSHDKEKATLRELSHTSLLDLVVEYSAQQLVVEGVSAGGIDLPEMWAPFERSGLVSKQGAFFASTLRYGSTFGLALPGTDAVGGNAAYMRIFSPRNFGALYGDLVDDEFPMWAYRRIEQGRNTHWRVYDEQAEYFLSEEDGRLRLLEVREHGMGVCPVVRFTCNEDLEGHVIGEPHKYKRDAERHDKTVYDRLSIQHYNSWRIRYAIHMSSEWSEEDREKFKLKLAHDDIMVGDGDTEFGTLDETDLTPMTAAQEADRDLLAAVSQTPVWAFNGGSMANLSADALVEAKSGNRQKVWSIQRGLNRPLCAFLRLAAQAEGRMSDASRFDLDIAWSDVGSQTLSAAADALGKLATSLGVPVAKLWEMIPGISHQTVEDWRAYAESHPSDDDAAAIAYARQVMPDGANE